ncbi:hypothetical protein [Oceanospirillum sanctuarii]|nr:hypothetical protein [Oceanospirillum sanctuarii]
MAFNASNKALLADKFSNTLLWIDCSAGALALLEWKWRDQLLTR